MIVAPARTSQKQTYMGASGERGSNQRELSVMAGAEVVRLRSDAAAADAREMALEDLCAALGARLDDCWDRLDDAATQLHALHGVSFEAILDHLHNLTRC